MICTIHQPNYLPYSGFFEKMSNADITILYDNTQFKKNDFQNRNRIRLKEKGIWLTVPVSYHFGDLINQVKINNNTPWTKQHWKSIQLNYFKAPYFNDYKAEFENVYSKRWDKLVDINVTLIKLCSGLLKLKTKIVLASDLTNLQTKSTDALLTLCKAVKCDEYISGVDGKKYLELDKFAKSGIKVRFQDYKHPVYKQVYPGFEPYMSVIDMLFNCGPDCLEILKKDNTY